MGNLPDFLGVGAARCGTTWLARCLAEHPEVRVVPEELHFFDSHWDRGLDWYRNHFPELDEQVLQGEKSPEYMYHREARERMGKTVPNAKLLVLLRDPVDRAYSAYWQYASELDADSFEEAWEERPSLVEKGFYADQLDHLLELYPRDQVKVLFFDDLQEDDEAFLREAYEFLGVEPSFRPSYLGQTYNAIVFPRFQRTLEILGLGGLVDAAKTVGLDRPVRWLHRRFETGSYPPMDPKTRDRLETRYASANRDLEELLGRRVPWA